MVDENNKDKITKIITKALAPLAALKHLSRVDWANIEGGKASKKSNKDPANKQKSEETNFEKGK